MIEQRIIESLNRDYDIKAINLSLLPIGADINASIYKANAQDKSYFIKLKRGLHQDISATIITLLQDAGIDHIIPPIKTKEGQPISHVDEYTLIVSTFIEGQDGFTRDLSNEQWVTLGKVMRKIHEVNVPPTVQHMIRREVFSSKWREALKKLWTQIESEINPDEISSAFIAFMKNHAAEIQQIAHTAERLAKQSQDKTPEFVLCHADIHGGNVLLEGNGFVYIVDWDDPIMAPKERDLMFIGAGVANVWNKEHEEELFYKGYGKTQVNSAMLTYYRHERIVEDIVELAQQIMLTSLDTQSRLQAYQHFIDQFEPQGVVDIAFKTDIMAWGKHFLEFTGYSIKGDPHIFVKTPWSCVVRYATSAGDFYVKQTPPDLFIETDVIKTIQKNVPHSPTPRIIAINEKSHCFMMESCGDYSLRTKFNGIIDPVLLVQGLKSYISILRSFEHNCDTLLAIGVPDWRMGQIPRLYIELLDQKEMLLEEGLTSDEIEKLKKLVPTIQSISELLSQQNIKETLVNGDFNENNLIINESTQYISIIDWGESVITHPFFTIASHLRSLARRYKLELNAKLLENIKQECLSCWLDVASFNELENIYQQMLILQPIFSVLAIYRLQTATHNKSKQMQNWFMSGFLKTLLENQAQ